MKKLFIDLGAVVSVYISIVWTERFWTEISDKYVTLVAANFHGKRAD